MITITKVDSQGFAKDDSVFGVDVENFHTEADKVDFLRIFSKQLNINIIVELNTAVKFLASDNVLIEDWNQLVDNLDCVEISIDKNISEKMKDFIKAENQEDQYTQLLCVSEVAAGNSC